MTNKEAIKNLKQLLRWYVKEEPMSETVYTREAVQMAIEALERSEKFQQKAEIVISQLRADRDRLEEAIEKMRAEIEAIIGEHDLDDYDFCSGLIVARKIIDKHTKEREEE